MPTQYTDDQINEYMGHVRQTAGSRYTPDQLSEYEQHIRDTAGPHALGLDPERPAETDLYGNDDSRMKAGFASPEGAAPLVKPGFQTVQKNSTGDLVAKAPDGRWYKDQDSLLKNPGNWAESALGKAPGTAGMMAGGALGGFLGGGEVASPTAIPAAIAGAGAGSAAGESFRQGIGGLLGVQKKPDTQAIGQEAANGAFAETGGKALGAIAKPVIDVAKPYVHSAMSAVMSKLSGVDRDAIMRTLEKRGAVFNPMDSQTIAKQGASELAARDSAEGTAIAEARQNLRTDAGLHPLDTSKVIAPTLGAIDTAAANAKGEGQLTPTEGPAMRNRAILNLTSPPAVGIGPPAPIATVDDLSRYADGLQADVGKSFQKSGLPSDGSARSVSINQTQLGRIKGLLHTFSPKYGAADARFSSFADQSKLLKPLTNEGTQQSFVDNLIKSPAKDNARDAAAQLVPNAYENMLDLGANRAWEAPAAATFGGGIFHLTPRDKLRLGLGGASYLVHHNDPNREGLAASLLGAAALTTPEASQAFIKMGLPRLMQTPAALIKKNFSPFTTPEK